MTEKKKIMLEEKIKNYIMHFYKNKLIIFYILCISLYFEYYNDSYYPKH